MIVTRGVQILTVELFLSQKQQYVRAKIHTSSRLMRKFPLGQDRFARQYWALPNMGGIVVEGVETSLYGDTQTDGVKGLEELGKRDVQEESSGLNKVGNDHISADSSAKHSSESPVRVKEGDEKEEIDVEKEEEEKEEEEEEEGEREREVTVEHSSALTREPEEQLCSDMPQTDSADQSACVENDDSAVSFGEHGRRTCAVVCVEPGPDTGMEWNQGNVQHRLPFEEKASFSASVSDGEARKTPVNEISEKNANPSSPITATPTATPTITPMAQGKGTHYSSTSLPVPSTSVAPDQSNDSPETNKPSPVTDQPDPGHAHHSTGNHRNDENMQTTTSVCVAPPEAPSHSKLPQWFSLLPRQPCEVTPVAFTNTDSSSSTTVAATAHVVANQQVSPTQHQYIMAAPMAAAQYAYVTPSGHVIGQPMVQQFGLGYTLVGVPQVGVPQVGVPQVGVSQVGVPQVGVPQVGVPQVGVPQVGVPQVGVPQAQYVAVNPSQQVQYVVAGQQGLSCVAVGGQQYIALGGNQMVQVASGVGEGGEVGGSEGVTVGVAVTSPEENKTSGDLPCPGGEERNMTPHTVSDTRKDTQLTTTEETSQPVTAQDSAPQSAPTNPVLAVTHEEKEERESGGGEGGSKLSESEVIQTVANPAQLHTPQQQKQQEAEVSALITQDSLHQWPCRTCARGRCIISVVQLYYSPCTCVYGLCSCKHMLTEGSLPFSPPFLSPLLSPLPSLQGAPKYLTAVVPSGPGGQPQYVSLPADPRVVSGQCSYAVLQQGDGTSQIVMVENTSIGR